MQLSPFSEKYLKSCIRAGDSKKFGVDLSLDCDVLLTQTREQVDGGTITFQHLEVPIPKGRKLFLVNNFHGALALRATAKSLNLQYGVSAGSRNAVVNGVLEALFDSSPFHVLRCDIKSFFENVDAKIILTEILSSTKTHTHVKTVLRTLETSGLLGGALSGVPRGLGLSTTFAELALRKLDREAKEIEGVYRYFRFADDILLFSTQKVEPALAKIKDIISPSFELNSKTGKTDLASLPDSDENPCTTTASKFSYLGYSFECENGIRARKSRQILVKISSEKIKVRKTRVILSLKAFNKDKNAALLLNRVKFLTSNYEIRKTGHTHGPKRAKVKTGIYFNYQKCGLYQHGKQGPEKVSAAPTELKELDGFLASLLWGSNSQFRTKIQASFTQKQLAELKALSFYKGFTDKMTVRFNRGTISEIRKAWLHA
ncbi:putative reverse transcriptase [Octadecabacter antarcticus 307]|uniref:Putative reverse transcriptase n=1 Tax=Octadecabacter antarcticus 307 TaxID=391626 RepID=M9R705_9RHOB|nr:antiviral reverse transcriptase Drt3a [Octadecabacter antarcticus]AGI67543.1 putative reverse transcriptase [Octadecabacter antarcticus 307]